MALIDFSTLTNDILVGWMRSLLASNEQDVEGFLRIIKMPLADQQASLQAYLTARIAANTALAAQLDAQNTQAKNGLVADSAACNTGIATIQS